MLYKRLEKAENVMLYTKMPEKNHSVPVISFNIKNTESETVAKILNDSYNIAVRAGLHCAPLAQKKLRHSGYRNRKSCCIGIYNKK